MKILLTNDDGYGSTGLNFLIDYFNNTDHKIYVIAPESERSGSSHSITLTDTIKLNKKEGNLFILNGTPADCVHLGMIGLLPEKIDAVIAGINLGPNLGTDIIFSGTVGAARQAALAGLPAIALSINKFKEPFYFDIIKDFLDKFFFKLIEKHDPSFLYNINFPNIKHSELKGIQFTQPGIRVYKDKLIEFHAPFQGKYYWIGGEKPDYLQEEGTDIETIFQNKISVSMLKIMPESVDLKKYQFFNDFFLDTDHL